ncbi:unnamed protein product [Prunus armeniaca]|uniref:Uncharacterized protein n=1 Tax=Prunus armeniaca TaxID=36596 RepID=A0A6J5TZI4_PRUAR|nr:unnamed protein product [Prunus armeniaca]
MVAHTQDYTKKKGPESDLGFFHSSFFPLLPFRFRLSQPPPIPNLSLSHHVTPLSAAALFSASLSRCRHAAIGDPIRSQRPPLLLV